MKTLNVDLAGAPYPIHVGPGLLTRTELLLPHLAIPQVAIVTNSTVAPLYLDLLRDRLGQAGIEVLSIVLPDGEAYKTLDSWCHILDEMLVRHCERKTSLIALGGGVIGDLAGFAAATFLRGVPLIQIPTTLLAQVDSSVGGKTGINHSMGKNLIGAFHQPRLVLADTHTLNTLPDREYRAGVAEVIKYGLIRDLPFLDWLEEHLDALMERDPQILTRAILESCRNKAEVVARDEFETNGMRALLNLGHTFGHAIETGAGYGVWLHGEAVAAGMLMAADLSERMGWISERDLLRVESLIRRAGLPLRAPDLGADRYLQLMASDKKVEAGNLRLVLFKPLGQAILTREADPACLKSVLTAGEGRYLERLDEVPQ